MKKGYLSEYFVAVAAKKLSEVEVNPSRSHQHEFNGSFELKRVFGETQRQNFPAIFMWLDDRNEGISSEGSVTWYDARENHPKRSEFRLYFKSGGIMEMAKAGDTIIIAKRTDNSVLIIVVQPNTTIERQLYWLFGLSLPEGNLFSTIDLNESDHHLDFATRFIMDELGIEIEEPESDKIDGLLEEFGFSFPSTSIFSEFARSTFKNSYDPIEDPDGALVSIMDWEEKLFRRLERRIVSDRLKKGFEGSNGQDVDGFLSFSLSVQNRRKSRAGYAFEGHLAYIFNQNKMMFSQQVETENKAKPDFIFPGISQYRDLSYPTELLTMLGVKTTCKDRWRQVLPEAARIPKKHLLTLEPGISSNQTDEMKAHSLQLIIPESIKSSYTNDQRLWLMNLREFIRLVNSKKVA